MDRFLVPRLGLVAIIGLATVLIGVIVLRSPDTHANLWNSAQTGYARTSQALVGHEAADVELKLVEQQGITAGKPASLEPGRAIYLGRGCAMCHGLDARGGAVGPSLAGTNPEIVKRMVRDGPGGMPAYTETHLSDADLAEMANYLQNLPVVRPGSSEIAALQGITWDPSVSPSILLQGKAAVRRSCGACHSQPTAEEIRSAFASDFDATSLVADMASRQTNLSLQDARAIAYYMLAVLHGVDLVKAP
ncbi:MAG: cytochrome c [Chloroflexi bacterium]|nr:cytochrome c [Chloroflexota bacterium]